MSLPPEKIEAIRKQASILDVVGQEITLKKQGQRYVGLCPFHGEKTPSFSVTADKGLYYCFGCHAGGDVFSFVMRLRGLNFQEAARHLAQRVGVELEPPSPAAKKRARAEREIDRANQYALAFFTRALTTPSGKATRAYLESRRVSPAQAEAWKLGAGGDTGELLAYLEAKKVPLSLAAKAGILTEDGRRSLFDNRLVFPIFDRQGRLTGFGGRRIGDGFGPKYVNTRESLLFSKRRLLFGWLQAEETIRRTRRVVVVEGFMDVLACHGAGVTNAVASLGTAFTEEHAKACQRLAKEGVLLFDADAAGKKAAREATLALIGAGLKALVTALPEGEDPDSLVRAGGSGALTSRLEDAQPALEHFIVETIGQQQTIEEKAEAAAELAPLIAALGSGLERDLYTARLAEKVGVSPEQMTVHLREAHRRAIRTSKRGGRREQPAARGAERDPNEPPPPEVMGGPPPDYAELDAPPPAPPAPELPSKIEMKMLRELLLHPTLRPSLGALGDYTSEPMRALLDDLADSEDPQEVVLARHLPSAWVSRFKSLPPDPSATEQDTETRAKQTYDDVLGRLKTLHLELAWREAMEALEAAERRGEDTEELRRRVQNLTRRKHALKRPHPPP